MYTHVIFDLDGTLLNTIQDLARAGNHVCALHGWPEYPVEAYKTMVGNGAAKLVERFAPAGTPQEVQAQALKEFSLWYDQHKEDTTAPYDGMPQLIARLNRAGVGTAVLSNKPDFMAGPVVERYYPGLFPVVQGAVDGLPIKPDPALALRLMERMGARRETTLFVGDSDVDMATALAAGLDGCGVLWGFRTRQELEQAGAAWLAETPGELEQLILGERTKEGTV